MGNFSKFIRPGYTRVSAISDDKEVNVVSFLGKNEANEEELITVLINNSFQEKEIDLQGVGFGEIISYTTDSESDLEEQSITSQELTIPRQSIVTLKSVTTNE